MKFTHSWNLHWRKMSNKTPAQPQRILNKISECRERGDFTDFRIVCEGVDFYVHKIVLCSQSPVFRTACTGNFKEAADSTYQMTEETTIVVKKMLQYLYTGDYSEQIEDDSTVVPSEVPQVSISGLQLHAQLFALGDKYSIPELCELAVDKYIYRTVCHFEPFDYLDSIPDVFFSALKNNMELRNVAICTWRDLLVSHLRDPAVRVKYDLIAGQVPEFAKEVLDTYINAPIRGDCENCGRGRSMRALQVKCQKCGRGKDVSDCSWGLKYR